MLHTPSLPLPWSDWADLHAGRCCTGNRHFSTGHKASPLGLRGKTRLARERSGRKNGMLTRMG
ncbi:hypothetical protein [Acetobacter senegalensis]|uniref:hypothetical protein n=1 Tax=Acetobacter senegalensis TaxID=446692 RepID=UPI0026504A43|nr:hypothetical protein [Acetobacter senegalensis]MDN7352887.1 hypothetical protein [Acetobacter senegalensis]